MGKFDGILMASDLDGTLLRGDKSVSRENTEALDYFMSEGGLFTVMTGRMPYALSKVLDKVSVNAPVGCGNGLAIYDTVEKKHLWKTCIDIGVLKIADYIMERFDDVGIEITQHDGVLCIVTNQTVRKHLDDEKLEYVEGSLEGFKGEMAKLFFAAPPSRLVQVIEAVETLPISNEYQCLRSDVPYYEILPKGVGKGPLLVRLAEILGVPMSRTVAVGDNDNDESMLRAAGLGIAVANASKTALDASDLVTVSNEEHAIAKIVSDIEHGVIKI